MSNKFKKIKTVLLSIMIVIILASVACKTDGVSTNQITKTDLISSGDTVKSSDIDPDKEYSSAHEVAAYINEFDELPSNYITKKEANKLGWPDDGHLSEVAPGKSIGGDRFGNREGLLPKERGRQYFECDIDYVKGARNAKRLVYSNDGLIFYTEDHYASFEQLY